MVATIYSGYKYGTSAAGTAGGIVTWSYATLPGQTYSFSGAIVQTAYRNAIAAAFAAWEAVINIDFEYDASDSNNNSIRLGWDIIDGAGGTAAGSTTQVTVRTDYDAIKYSEIRFELAEDWTTDIVADPTGIDFYAQALRLIGRALGLAPSTDVTSVMHPTAGVRVLSATDLASIKALYGNPIVVVAPTAEADELNGTAAANTIDGLAGDDVISGLAGADKLYGSAGNDQLYGGLGNDILRGGDDDDYLDGQSENDTLYGGNGNDAMFGQTGQDKLYGEAGNDYILGGTGTDVVSGGDGDDYVNSGGGYDTFIFAVGDDHDTFAAFANGLDKINVSTFDYATFAALKLDAHQAGTSVVIQFNETDSLTIQNFTMAMMTAGDFIL